MLKILDTSIDRMDQKMNGSEKIVVAMLAFLVIVLGVSAYEYNASMNRIQHDINIMQQHQAYQIV